MSKYKINIDKPLPSEKQIAQYKDFDSLYREYQVTTRFQAWRNLYKNPRYFAAVAAAAAIMFLVSQSVKEETTPDLQAQNQSSVLESISIPFQETTVSSNSQTVVLLASEDGQLTIPANAFVDENGNPVSGEVDFRYREIPNSSKEITEDLSFNSIALLEIEAFQSGEKVFISQDNPLEIAYVTQEEDESYNVYQLNPTEKSWAQSGDDRVTVLQPSNSTIPPRPQRPQLADASMSGMRIKVVANEPLKPFRIKSELSDFPELQILNGVNWVHAGNNNATDPWAKGIIGQDWDDALVKKLDNDRYEITFTRRDASTQQTTSFKTIARPEYAGNSYEDAMAIYEDLLQKYKDSQKLAEQNQEEEARIEQENKEKLAKYNKDLTAWEAKYGNSNESNEPTKYKRTFEVKSLGVHSLGKPTQVSNQK